MSQPGLTEKPEWKALIDHQASLSGTHMRDLFEQDPGRFEHFFATAAGISLDYSKNLLTRETMPHLMSLARACQVPEQIQAMFRGDNINTSEKRPALHVALRNLGDDPITVEGTDIMPEVRSTLGRMEEFV